MSQRNKRGNGILHLGIGRVPVYFGVVEIVKNLVVTHFLAIVEQGHAIDGEEQRCEGVFVGAIHTLERLATIVEVLIVIG